MPADLQFWHPGHIGEAKGKLLWRVVNMIGTPIPAGLDEFPDDGRAVNDVYELIFTNSSGTVTATVDALIGGTKNAFRNMSGVSLVADGTTLNKEAVPGVWFPVSASVVTGHKARIAVGNFLDDNGSYTAFFGWGIVQAGYATTQQQIAIKNVGDATAAVCRICSVPGSSWGGTNAESFILSIHEHSSDARQKLAAAATHTITFANWGTGSGGHKIADILVGGLTAVVGALFDGTTLYEWGSGNGYDDAHDYLAGLGIILQNTTADPTGISATLTVVANHLYTQFAPEVSGAPGAWSTDDLPVTQAGQSSQQILAGGYALAWQKWVLPTGAVAGPYRLNGIVAKALTV